MLFRSKIDTFQVPESRDYIFVAYDNLIRVEPFLHNLPIEEAYQFFLELPYKEIILDEAQNYVRPTFSAEYVDVTLKRKFKTGQWNSLLVWAKVEESL